MVKEPSYGLPSQPCADGSLPVLKPSTEPSGAFTLELGFARDPLHEQLTRQGLPFDQSTIDHLDRDADAASRLKVRGVLSYSVGNAAYEKIIKRVWAEVRRAIKAQGMNR